MTARDRTVVIAVFAVAALVAAWLLVVQPKRGAATKLSTSIHAVQAQLATLQTQVAADRQARASFPVEYAEIARLGEAVPQDDNVPSLIYELQSAAKASGVDFGGLQLTPSTPGSSTGPSPSSGPSTSSGSSTSSGPSASSGSSASSGPSASAGASAASAAALPPGVSAGSAGFDTEQFTFSFSGKFFNLSDFLGRLDRFVVATGSTVRVSGRLLTLNALTLGPGSQGFPDMVANVSATTYLLPASQGLLGGGTSASPGSPPAGSSGGASSGAGLPPSSGTGAAGSSGATPAPAAAISGLPAISGALR